jgi:molecular chaperone DnaK
VSAKDMATGKAQSIRIEASSGLTQQDIDKMVKDAEANAADDRRRRNEVEARNKADQLVYETEKNLAEIGDKVSPDEKAKVQAGIARVKEALETSDVEEVKSSMEALVGLWSGVAKAMYEKAAAGAGTAGRTAGAAGGADKPTADRDEAVDADYEVVD